MARKKWISVDKLNPGDVVRRKYGTDFEYGRIVSVWDTGFGDHDCYIAFVGTRFNDLFPKKNPEKPYVLRYYAVSLEKLVTKGR
jgi:hypothetical protein